MRAAMATLPLSFDPRFEGECTFDDNSPLAQWNPLTPTRKLIEFPLSNLAPICCSA